MKQVVPGWLFKLIRYGIIYHFLTIVALIPAYI
jgi:hypothetical protein